MQVLRSIFGFAGCFIPKRKPPRQRHVCLVSYAEADKLLKANEGWKLAWEEDTNNRPNMVYLERYL